MGLNKNPIGLGDTVENILEATGIAKVVKSVIKTCNCGKRKDLSFAESIGSKK